MRVPTADIKVAIIKYHTVIELSNKDISEIFGGKVGNSRMRSLKKAAVAKMIEKNQPSFNAYRVNTRCAYEAWGIDIEMFERSYKKLEKLGLLEK